MSTYCTWCNCITRRLFLTFVFLLKTPPADRDTDEDGLGLAHTLFLDNEVDLGTSHACGSSIALSLRGSRSGR
jgi:hypothetical protein